MRFLRYIAHNIHIDLNFELTLIRKKINDSNFLSFNLYLFLFHCRTKQRKCSVQAKTVKNCHLVPFKDHISLLKHSKNIIRSFINILFVTLRKLLWKKNFCTLLGAFINVIDPKTFFLPVCAYVHANIWNGVTNGQLSLIQYF